MAVAASADPSPTFPSPASCSWRSCQALVAATFLASPKIYLRILLPSRALIDVHFRCKCVEGKNGSVDFPVCENSGDFQSALGVVRRAYLKFDHEALCLFTTVIRPHTNLVMMFVPILL